MSFKHSNEGAGMSPDAGSGDSKRHKAARVKSLPELARLALAAAWTGTPDPESAA